MGLIKASALDEIDFDVSTTDIRNIINAGGMSDIEIAACAYCRALKDFENFLHCTEPLNDIMRVAMESFTENAPYPIRDFSK